MFRWEEGRVIYLEELIKNLVDNEFKNLLISEEVLNLAVIVEDIYECRIGPNDANIGIVDMMTAIEELYRKELLFLDMVIHSYDGYGRGRIFICNDFYLDTK